MAMLAEGQALGAPGHGTGSTRARRAMAGSRADRSLPGWAGDIVHMGSILTLGPSPRSHQLGGQGQGLAQQLCPQLPRLTSGAHSTGTGSLCDPPCAPLGRQPLRPLHDHRGSPLAACLRADHAGSQALQEVSAGVAESALGNLQGSFGRGRWDMGSWQQLMGSTALPWQLCLPQGAHPAAGFTPSSPLLHSFLLPGGAKPALPGTALLGAPSWSCQLPFHHSPPSFLPAQC